MRIPRILLAAGASGSGKTLITCGLLQALVNRNLTVASFKCGPDYIDPMFHSRVIGAKSANLDTFFTSPEVTRYLLSENAANCEIAVMEGVMGYYDGVAGTTTKASAYDLADITDTPVILIVNSKGMSVSLVAYIKGFLEYKKNSHIKGVIFNQMSAMLYPRMKKLVQEQLGIQVLGYVPRVEDCLIESRHLGLILPEEIPGLKQRLYRLSQILNDTLEIDEILKLAVETSKIDVPDKLEKVDPSFGWSLPKKEKKLRIGLAKDEAFCFFYEDNFRLLQQMGAELVPFSPIHDKKLPKDIQGLLLYGGYPELYGKQLEENQEMRQQIREAIYDQMPVLAECGGFMYLHQQMEGMDGKLYQMADVIKGKAYRTPRLTRFGYITLEQKLSVLGHTDLGSIPAHEFHYFDSNSCGEAFHASKPESLRGWECIWGSDRILAGFPHLYYYGNPRIPQAFLERCLAFRQEKSLKNKGDQ